MTIFLYQLKNELWKLFGKKRTYIGFGMFLLGQNVIILLYRFTRATHDLTRALERNGLVASKFLSILTIGTLMVTVMAYTLLPLYVALVGGDLVAKEAEDGTLRMILCRPVSRLRLLMLKWLAGSVFSFSLVLSLGIFGLVFSAFWFPWGGLFTVPPLLPFGACESAEGLHRYLLAHLFMVPKAVSIMTMGFMFSCFNVKPAAATILALSLTLISGIMQELPYFNGLQNWFITFHMNIWREIFAEHIPWAQVWQSMLMLAGYNLSFLLIGCTAFHVRDIKS